MPGVRRFLFHIKWLFKKRYQIVFGYDPAIKDKKNFVCMKYDRKYNKFKMVG